MKKIYISAPISGYDIEERKIFFANKAKEIEDLGFIPVNPMEKVGSYEKRHAILREDTKLLLECDEIWLYGDFVNSNGCMYEIEVARNCGIKMKIK